MPNKLIEQEQKNDVNAVDTVRAFVESGKEGVEIEAANSMLDYAVGPPINYDLLERIEILEQKVAKMEKQPSVSKSEPV